MNRRDFFKYCAAMGASLVIESATAHAMWLGDASGRDFPPDMFVIDAHAHPDTFPCTPSLCDVSSTQGKIKALGMNASCFAGVGDKNRPTGGVALSLDELLAQLDIVINLAKKGKVSLVRRASDVPSYVQPETFVPGAIMAVEGLSPLRADVAKIDLLYNYGVRVITPMHYMVNEIGDIMTQPAQWGQLTDVGAKMVERMMALGIIVDVAHAHADTLQGIADIALANDVPIIDSHTCLSRRKNPYGTTRARTREEMERVANTGGIVCTWPLAVQGGESQRTSLLDWAAENLEIARTIGIEHVGLGTDAGGGVPDFVEGYKSIMDLPRLVDAMYQVGFKPIEVSAYMGGNILRIIKRCLE
jgi:microsomal dipeptidase-like Zn-dependent dipeptidase